MRKQTIAILTAWLLLLAATPQAQSALWMLVNGSLRASRPVQFSTGTSSLPGIAFAVDPTTGFFRNGAGTIQVVSGGSFGGAFSATNWTSPNILYIGAGQDMSFTRAAAGEVTLPAVTFAALGTPANGTEAYCSDCAPTTPASCPATKASCICTSGGVGSKAFRANSLWYCPF